MTLRGAQGAIALTREFLASPRVTSAVAACAIGAGFLANTILRLIGWPGLIAILAVLVVICLATLVWRQRETTLLGPLPVSLLTYLGWATLSVLWSSYRWPAVGGVAYLFAFSVLAVYVAVTRDTIQVVRAFGDVLRLVLVVSFALEIISGVLVDEPIAVLGIEGKLANLGPIQGIMGTRNQIGLVAVLGIVTFAIELVTRSVSRSLGIGSLALGAAAVLLSRSPVVTGVAVALAAAVLTLYLIRRVKPDRRVPWQWATLVAAITLAILAWAFRSQIITVLSGTSELRYRLTLWRGLWDLIGRNPLQGWGWIGQWRPDIQPFTLFAGERSSASALNAYIDVWFQLGLAGIFIFLVLVGLAFVRSWLLAGRRRNVVFAWPALVLVVLIVSSLAESSILVEYGWMAFVVCCIKAASELSWRRAFTTVSEDTPD